MLRHRLGPWRDWPLLLVVAAAWLAAAGCSPGPRAYPVKGKVVFKDNGKPLGSGTVLFESVADPNQRASGEIQADGTYTLANNVGANGAVEGEHRVLIMTPLPEYGQNPRGPFDPRYQRFDTSGLRYTVKPGENNYEIQLDRPRR
jgi:hypothetical protein